MIPRLIVKLRNQRKADLLVVAAVSSTDVPGTAVALDVLSTHELQQYSQLRHPLRKQHYVLGRLAAKTAVSERINDKDLRQISIESGSCGQPLLRARSNCCTSVTISHSRNSALAIAYDSSQFFGVDIEHVGGRQRLALKHQRTPARIVKAACASLSDLHVSYLIWTVREALSKALLCGMTCSPTVLDIDTFAIRDDGVCVGDFVHLDRYQFCAWLSHSFAIAIACSRKARLGTHLSSIRRFVTTNVRA
jgi:4'-phosphopantetheinyl transferase